MLDILSKPCTAFSGMSRMAHGALIDVALAIKTADSAGSGNPVLTFDDANGAVIDLDLRGSTADIVARLTQLSKQEAKASQMDKTTDPHEPIRGPGRPKLGVVAREVTLLPRHWEWLGAQQGGASQVLRRLIDQARRGEGDRSQIRVAQERTYRFLSALAGDLPGFEEASRALFSGDLDGFAARMALWPEDVKTYALALSAGTAPR